MSCFIEYLKEESAELIKEIGYMHKALKNAPDGRLEIKKDKKRARVQYYYKGKEKESRLRYIRNDDKDLAYKIAQRDYNMNVLKNLEQRYRNVHELYEIYKVTDTQEQYLKTHAERKKLITPRDCDLSDDEYASQWQQKVYQGKVFTQSDPEIYTVKGERVRSKSEKIIADALEREEIPYRYEHPVCLPGNLYLYPDFTVLNKRTRKEYFLEHFGMMDSPEYVENMIRKVEEFEKYGIFPGVKLLMTFETKNRPLNTAILTRIIQEFFR